MIIRGIEKRDFDYIVAVFDHWWGGPSSEKASPFFFHELGQYALIAEEDGQVIGFLLGLVAAGSHTGYVHLWASTRTIADVVWASGCTSTSASAVSAAGCAS